VARNWSRKQLPGPTDRACLGPGTVVTLGGHRARVGSVVDEGTLYAIGGAELRLVDLTRRSELTALVLAGGTLAGDASVVVRQLNWQEHGEMAGSTRRRGRI
jgi:hypothetical protein